MEKGNMLLVHGGAPTAVMNASVYGVLQAAQGRVDAVLGANGGTGGLMAEKFIDLTRLNAEERVQLLITPGTVIGTSRTPLAEADYQRMAEIAIRHNIRYILFNGGNGTMLVPDSPEVTALRAEFARCWHWIGRNATGLWW